MVINVDIQKAKEMFLKYNGNYFHMERDDVLYEYRGYSISKEQEKIWINEIINNYINKLRISGDDMSRNLYINYFYSICDIIIRSNDVSNVILLYEEFKKKSYYDSFSKLLMLESIYKCLKYYKVQNINNIKFEAKELLNSEITVDESFFPLLSVTSTDNNYCKYITNRIKELKKEL